VEEGPGRAAEDFDVGGTVRRWTWGGIWVGSEGGWGDEGRFHSLEICK
jgi:hypothetical protein